jgi:hypothetical protein
MSTLAERWTIANRIQRAFENLGEEEAVARDIGFHMTDWLRDATDLLHMYETIDSLSDDEITGFLFRFLGHVPNHLNAAAKLSGMGKVQDVFDVGIFEDDD